MKKFFIVLVVFFMLSSFTVKVEDDGYFAVKYETTQVSGMSYLIVYNKYIRISGGVSTGVSVVNLTKDKLEVEKLKLEIQYLKKQLN